MKLPSEFLQLPLLFDAERLRAEVLAIEETQWLPHPQGHPGNSALPLVAANGDPANNATKGPMRPTPVLARLPALRQVMATLDTVVGRTRLMRLQGHAEATPHTDTNYYWSEHLRVHVPVITTPDVRFICGERAVHMAAGECWVFDTWRPHNVLNDANSARIHLVIDTVGSPGLARWLREGRDPFAPPAAWSPRSVSFSPDAMPDVRWETCNQPGVMSPWELRQHVRQLLDEAGSLAQSLELDTVRAAAEHLSLAWRALWAEHGEDASAIDRYASVLSAFDASIAPLAGRIPLPNGVDLVEALRQWIVRVALNPELCGGATKTTASAVTRSATPTPGTVVNAPRVRVTSTPSDAFAAPVFIVSPPRSGSSLLFETLALSPDFFTIGGESHALIEGIEALHPAAHGFDSNRLFARDAESTVVAELRRRFAERLRDRDGRAPTQGSDATRLLEKTPKNALRIPFLATAFPGARFIYLYRDARETLSSMLDAWKSGRFVTYPNLPEWSGPPWSLLLPSGWREWRGLPIAEIVARQWQATVRILLDDLHALPPESWCVASYDRLIEQPREEIARLCEFLGARFDRELTVPLPSSRHTLTSPEPNKWKRNADELAPVMHLVAAQAQRAHQLFAEPPAVRPAGRRHLPTHPGRQHVSFTTEPVTDSASATPARKAPIEANVDKTFASVFTESFAELLRRAGGSLAITTYQSGRLILARPREAGLNTHLRAFASPMGLARRGSRIALGTLRHVCEFQHHAGVAAAEAGDVPLDACFMPTGTQVTGDIRVHDMAFAGDELWVVNTRFSCLATLDGQHSFVPRWRPRFVTALAAEDRCHLNGLAIVDDKPRYVTALGESDVKQGWREQKGVGGVLIEIDTHEFIARGLCMPHSPRWHQGKLWVLESGRGTLSTVDLASGRVDTVATLPGFTRGLCFVGPYAFVGLSQVRESLFAGVPIADREHDRHCGVWAVDTRDGRVMGFLRFEGEVREIYDVQFLEGLRNPDVVEPGDPRTEHAFLLPSDAEERLRA